MNGGVLIYFQSFLSAFLFVLALIVWLLVRGKSFYATFRSKLVFTLVLVFGLTFLVRSFSFLGQGVIWVQYVFQLLLLFVLVVACFSLYFRFRRSEAGVVEEVIEKKPEDIKAKLLNLKSELDLRAKELKRQEKDLLKKERFLTKFDSKLKNREAKLDAREDEVDEHFAKAKELKSELFKKESLVEDELLKIERSKAKAVDVDKLRAELERDMDALDDREAAFDQELIAYRQRLQDFEEEKEDLAVEREKLEKLKASLEEEALLLKERKKRYLDNYEELDRERDRFDKERKKFESVKNSLVVNNKGKKALRGGRR